MQHSFQSPSPSRQAQCVSWCLISLAGALVQAISSLGRSSAYPLTTRHPAHKFLAGVMSLLQGSMAGNSWSTYQGARQSLYTFLRAFRLPSSLPLLPADIALYLSYLHGKGYSPNTMHGHPCVCHCRCAQNSWGYGPHRYFSDSEGPAGGAQGWASVHVIHGCPSLFRS